MVLVETTHSVVRVNQSKVGLDGDPWHSIQVPLRDDPADDKATPPLQAQMVNRSGHEPLLRPGTDHSLWIKQTSTTHEPTRFHGGCSFHIGDCS
jgi:hypothetical protein